MIFLRRFLIITFLLSFAPAYFALEPDEIWERVNRSVVRIQAEHLDGGLVTGSGFVCEISGRKCVLSNRHVVAGAKSVKIGPNESGLVAALGYRISPKLDLAIIELPSSVSTAALKQRDSGIKTGERVYAIGFPLGLNKSITSGLVSSQTAELLQFDAPISSGNSGGPLVDKDGLVIGVVTAGSLASENQVVQNLNFAIKSAVIPDLSLFQDPITSFFDAWLKLVAIETQLLDGIAKYRILEIHEYLIMEMGYAMMADERFLRKSFKDSATAEKGLDEARRILEIKRRELPPLIPSAITFLKEQQVVFDRIPDLYVGLGREELLTQFTRDQRPGGYFRFRLNIGETEIVPLLKSSLEYVKAKYEDTAYQIEYLADNLSKLREKDPTTLARWLALEDQEHPKRKSLRLDYRNLEEKSETERLTLFAESMIHHYVPTDASTWSHAREGKLTGAEFFKEGGMEGYLLDMFHPLALAEALKGNVEKAIGYIQNDFKYRKSGDSRLLAHLNACQGNFESAYKLYEKAFLSANARKKIDPFRLEINDGISQRVLILNELLEDGTELYNTAIIRKNLTAFHRFLQGKPAFIVLRLPTVQDAVASKTFREGSEFEQLLILRAFELREDWNKFKTVVQADPFAVAIYEKYWEAR